MATQFPGQNVLRRSFNQPLTHASPPCTLYTNYNVHIICGSYEPHLTNLMSGSDPYIRGTICERSATIRRRLPFDVPLPCAYTRANYLHKTPKQNRFSSRSLLPSNVVKQENEFRLLCNFAISNRYCELAGHIEMRCRALR